MALIRLRPLLRTWDLPGTIAFYTETLEFRCVAACDDPAWAELERDGVAIMLSGPNAHAGDVAPAFTGSIYISCDDVEDVWGKVHNRARVCYPIETFGYGMREFGIHDNNGYLIQFGQPAPDPDDTPV